MKTGTAWRLRAPAVRVDECDGWSRARADEQPDAPPRIPARRRLRPRTPASADSIFPSARTTLRAATTRCACRPRGLSARTCFTRSGCRSTPRRTARSPSPTRPAIIVLDAFSKGGAGVSSSGSSRTFELAENLDFNVGRKQQMRVGFLLEGGRYQNFDARNANGTFTYATSEAYELDQPMTFTQRNGQVNTRFNQYTPRVLLVRRHTAEQQALVRHRRPQRDAVAHRRPSEPDAAARVHLDAVGQPDQHPWRLRTVLRLV